MLNPKMGKDVGHYNPLEEVSDVWKSTSCSLLLIKMGMMSRAMVGVVPERDAIRFEQFRKQEQEIMRKKPELRKFKDAEPQPSDEVITIDVDIILSLERMANERGIDVNDLVNTRLRAMVYSFENGRAGSQRSDAIWHVPRYSC